MLNIPKEVKELFEKDSVRKNVRIHFPNGERADITNSNLIAESFSFTESVMSQSEFRFGLCEASMVEFECFGVENIKGYEIKAYHEIDISSLDEDFIDEYGMTSEDVAFPYYRVPYGKFTVDEALRQADMVRRKVTAYGKMVENLKPNEIELAKQTIPFEEKDNYSIDLLRYLYSNVSVDSIIPNATYTDTGEVGTTRLGLDNFLSIEIDAFGFDKLWNILTGLDTFFRLKMGKKLLELDSVFEELNNYILLNFPSEHEIFVSNWNDTYKDLCRNKLTMSVSTMAKTLELFFENEGYIDTYVSDEISSGGVHFFIPYCIRLVERNETLIEVTIRNVEEIEAQIVNLPSPISGIVVSYPLKKAKDGYYYIKDIPYDQLSKDIEEAIELQGKFGKVDRYGNFQMISVNNNLGLYPSEDLYPSETLYPREASGGILTKGNYLSAWYDDEYTKPYDRVSVSYKNTDEEEMYAEYLLVDIESDTYNASDYQAYSLSENYLIQNGTFTEEQITEILQTVGEALRNIRYMPCEIDAVGMPWVEAGDGLEIVTKNGAFDTLVLNRRINGIQRLIDNIEAN